MAKGDICNVSNCQKIITSKKGKKCGMHRARFHKYKSFDLPNYIGPPSYLKRMNYPNGIVKLCKIHGHLKIDEVYERRYKENKNYSCKLCVSSKNIEKKYKGLNSLDDYENLLKQQNNSCAICKQKNNTTRNGKIKRYNIDHCHNTNNVRGLLCSFCNSMLGYSRDSIEILESAIAYLKKHKD